MRASVLATGACLAALLAVLAPGRAEAGGWRGDGTSVFPGTTPPVSWSKEERVRWSVPLPSWGNASPVVAGDRVCVVNEPSLVACHALDDGRQLWTAQLDVLDAMTGTARTELAAKLAAAEADEVAYREHRTAYSRLQREVRRSAADPAAGVRLEEIARELATLEARLDAVAAYRTPPDKDIIGYATPTPATDGRRLYVLTGHGVIAAIGLDGSRVWTRWLGPQPAPMRGYHTGHASSPLLVDGTLVVPYGHLRGLDPETGEERWALEATWDHYGTPAVAEVAGRGVVITPGGRVVSARDGEVLTESLDGLYYIGHHAVGDVVYAVGNSGDVERGDKRVLAAAWRLVPTPDGGVEAKPLWRTDLPGGGRYYTQPVLHQGRLWVVGTQGEVLVVDAATGAMVRQSTLRDVLPQAEVYPSPTVAGGRLYVSTHFGHTVALDLHADGTWDVAGTSQLDEVRASPWFAGSRMYVRSLARLWCIEAR